MTKKTKINMHVVGIFVIVFGAYLVITNAPNYVGYIVALLGIALAVKPNAVKHLAYHNNEKTKPKKQTNVLKSKVQKSKKKGL